MKKCALFTLIGLVAAIPAAAEPLATIAVTPTTSMGQPAQTVTFVVQVTTTEDIGAMQFTLEYDSTIATFQSAALDASMPSGFFITNINTNLPSGPFSPGTNENVLVQLSGNGITDSFTGTQAVVLMTFQFQPDACGTSPMNFEATCQRTHLATLNLLPICDPALLSGSVSTNCATDSPDNRRGRFQLLQNIPNPFNPATTIRFELTQGMPVQLRIFDVSGRVVRVLVDDPMAEGVHAVGWNGRDDAGRLLPSGVYYSKLITPIGSDTRRLLMLK